MLKNIRVAITCGWIGEHTCFQPMRDAGVEYTPIQLKDWENEYDAAMQDYDCILLGGERFDKKRFDKLPRLKLLMRHGTGYDAIDVGYASEIGVAVANTPGANADSVAQFALTLMMCVGQQIMQYNNACKGISAWPQKMAKVLEGTVGIIGFGMIGRRLAKLLTVFPVDKILAYDPYVDAAVMEAAGAEKCNLRDIQEKADIISIHAQSIPETYHMINKEFFDGLKKEIILINTSRGQLVDEIALIEALGSGKVSGAGLDVLEVEKYDRGNPLIFMPNVVVTPHVATNNLSCRISVNEFCSRAIVDFFSGRPVKSIVNPAYKKNAR